MLRTISLLAAISVAALAGMGDAQPGRRREQDAARAGVLAGQVPLREIEQRIVPRVGGAEYLGPEYDPGSGIYRLKFMRDGSVFWIDVNARNGAVVGRSGN